MKYKINYLSDFPLTLRMMVAEDGGKVIGELGFPNCPFTVTLSSGGVFTAKRCWQATYAPDEETGEMTMDGLGNEDGHVVIYADSHELPKGVLYVAVDFQVPDENYSDGYRRLHFVQKSGIELVGIGGEDCDNVEVKLMLPPAFTAVSDEIDDTDVDVDKPADNEDALLALASAYNSGVDAIRIALEKKGVETSPTDSLVVLAGKIEAIGNG